MSSASSGPPGSVTLLAGRLVIARAPFLALVSGIFAAGPACDGAGDPVEGPARIDGGAQPGPARDAAVVTRDADSDRLPADAGACRDDDGIAATCRDAALADAAECTAALCEHFVAAYKSRVARRAIACLAVGTRCAECGLVALKEACPDETAEETCANVRTNCAARGKPDVLGPPGGCASTVAGLKFGARLAFVSCMTESCTASVDSCAK